MVVFGIFITVAMGTSALKPMLNSGTINGPIRESGTRETGEIYEKTGGRY